MGAFDRGGWLMFDDLIRLVCVVVVSLGTSTAAGAPPVRRSLEVVGGADGMRAAYQDRWALDVFRAPLIDADDAGWIAEMLVLSPAQRTALDALIEPYVTAVAALPLDLDTEVAGARSFSDTMRVGWSALPGVLREVGLSPRLLEDGIIEARIGSGTFPVDRDDPSLGAVVKVRVTIAAAPEQELPAGSAAAIDAAEARLAALLTPLEQARIDAAAAADLDPADRLDAFRRASARARDAVERYRMTRRVLGDELAGAFHDLLTDEQVARWPAVHRRARRERWLPWGALRGEAVDLAELFAAWHDARRAPLEAARQAEITAILEAWSIELDAALDRRETTRLAAHGGVDRALAQRHGAAALRAWRPLVAAHQRVRDLTRAAADAIVAALGADDGPEFGAQYLAAAYPQLSTDAPGERLYAEALAQRADDDPRADALRALDAERRAAWAALLERVRDQWWRDEPAIVTRRIEPAVDVLENDPPVIFPETPRLIEVLEEKAAFAGVWAQRLRDMP